MTTESAQVPENLTEPDAPSTMSPDEERPMAENKAPQAVVQEVVLKTVLEVGEKVEEEVETDIPLTKEMFEVQMRRLIKRARDAGLNPIRTMGRTYVRRGLAILDGLFAALENADDEKKKKE